MRYRKLSNVGDMTFGHQQHDFHRDVPEAVAQAVDTRLRLWLGEWFLDESEGTPYVQAMLGAHVQQSIEPAMRARLLNTQHVTSIDSFEFVRAAEERGITILASLSTEFGSVAITEVL